MTSRERGWEVLKEEYIQMTEQGISFVSMGDVGYPKRLLNIPDPPYGLFVKGSLPQEGGLSVALIGARDCSEYGKYVATELGRYLGKQGVSVISGMARGIDGISQIAALEEGGNSYGVLGCGVDICYPAQNRKLYDRLLENGGILSEYIPGTRPKAQHFPPRNRIVSGLADALVVIEARKKSGTLITVDMALEQGKEVYVVPGRVTDRLSDGCNSLLKQGAEVFLSPEEFVEELKEKRMRNGEEWRWAERTELSEEMRGKKDVYNCINEETTRNKNTKGTAIVSKQVLLEVLDFYPRSVSEIQKRLGTSNVFLNINTELMKLCLEGVVEQVMPGWYVRKL
ncbi:MAG: DNA-processing protein DprA [Lachnospiraceae bacterium]|nr:DNA-processing protein DprA [Lachnospiraceae bacterium]